mmetsp:Transcript_33277/g.106224  ORF Transcript_33277/g.106224 Transcript_33277/m.106224 type:complete len:409 (+) Transcript_33277:80-1306(+)
MRRLLLWAPAAWGLVVEMKSGPLRRLRRRATVEKVHEIHYLHEDVDRDLKWYTELEPKRKDVFSYLRELWVAETPEQLKAAAAASRGNGRTQTPTQTKDAAAESAAATKKKLASRVRTGVACGVLFTMWIFSSDSLYALGLAAQCCVAQLEYFRMAIASGASPARRIVLCSSVAMLWAACAFPGVHELIFPLAGTWIMLWLLLMRPNCSSITDISTTLMGLFYCAYLPSWWVRLRCSPLWQGPPPWQGSPLVLKPLLAPTATAAVATWWTCLGIAVSDIGAYFGGKTFGKRTLKSIGLGAAAKASPNKTIEGAVSGVASSATVATVGAFCMRWKYPLLLGPAYGVLLSLVALVGDLTASMLKRDSAVKDFGDLLPGHGGLLDRLDGFIFVAPMAFILLPRLCGCLPPA